MLRQLARLTRRVPGAGPEAVALSVYADAQDNLLPAAGEGVACVDDAARGVELLAAVWKVTGSPATLAWARGLLDFVLYMQDSDGLYLNFIEDWSGERNATGITSRPGVNFWQARALAATVAGALLLDDDRARRAARAGFAAARAASAPADVRSLHVLALDRWIHAGRGDADDRAQLGAWAEEIASTQRGSVLLNSSAERGAPHLWGHEQEPALAAAARTLGRPDLLAVAEASAMAVFAPAIRSGFGGDGPAGVQPYDVQSSIAAMDSLVAATQQVGYADLAALARQWFEGRNPAGRPVYDRVRGAVADGVDGNSVSTNSGAEANLVGGLALFDDAVAAAALAGV